MLLSDKYPFLTNYFTKALTNSNRALPQSLLFYGNDLDSQYKLATEIARLLNCKNDKSDDCDCLNCRWIREGNHPAVMTISRLDNKPEDDGAKTVISAKQSQMIKEMLVNSSEFHRVFIFCDRDNDGNISGLNPLNFQDITANSMLKIIEEPQPGVTFIFLTRYVDDVLSTIVSRSQCFFVPSKGVNTGINTGVNTGVNIEDYDYSCINGVFTNYFNFERKDVFDVSKKLQDLSKKVPVINIIEGIQNYILTLLKLNPERTDLIKDISVLENARRQAELGIKPVNIFDDICLKMIK